LFSLGGYEIFNLLLYDLKIFFNSTTNKTECNNQ